MLTSTNRGQEVPAPGSRGSQEYATVLHRIMHADGAAGMTVSAASEYLGIPQTRLRHGIRTGSIPAVRLPKSRHPHRWLIPALWCDLERLQQVAKARGLDKPRART